MVTRKRETPILGDRYANRYLPFYKLGTVFSDGVDSMEALEYAGLDYEYQIDKPTARYTKMIDGTEFVQNVEGDTRAVIRPPIAGRYDTPEWIGNVTDRYSLIQNREIAEFIQPLTETYPVKVAGELGRGRTVFYVLSGSEIKTTIPTEQINTFILVKDGKNGGTGLSIGMFAVRVACSNMQMFSKRVLNSWTIKHTASIRDNAEILIDGMTKLEQIKKDCSLLINKYSSTQMGYEDRQSMFAHSYPLPRKSTTLGILSDNTAQAERTKYLQRSYDLAVDRTKQMRTTAEELYSKVNDENPDVANTVWASIQAVTELSTWREGTKADSSVLFGARANEIYRAYEYAQYLR